MAKLVCREVSPEERKRITDAISAEFSREAIEKMVGGLCDAGHIIPNNVKTFNDQHLRFVAKQALGRFRDELEDTARPATVPVLGQSFFIEATDGTLGIAESRDVFTSGTVQKSGGRFGGSQRPTQDCLCVIRRINDDGQSMSDLFNSIEVPLDQLCLTEHQIRMLAANSSALFSRNPGLVLFQGADKGSLLVAQIRRNLKGGVELEIHSFEGGEKHMRARGFLLVVPAAALQ